MWIKKLYANFGNLSGKTLDLKPGLNIVSGKNESGKSTWSAFIRAMFFGISTREKAKTGYLPDKEKFLPWDGSPMYGRMELFKGNDEITIERTPSKSGSVLSKEVSLTSKGEPAPTGEELLGIAKGVYERTAFIGQAAVSIDGDKDTEKRILSIASSGDETISASEVISRLEKRKRLLRAPRGGGSLSELEAEIGALQSAIEVSGETEKKIASAEESLEICGKRIKEVSRKIEIKKAENLRSRRDLLDDAKKNLLEKEEKVKLSEKLPSREQYDSFLAKKSELQSVLLKAEKESFSLRELEAKEASLKEKSDSFTAFRGMTAELAEKSAMSDIDKAENLPSARTGLAVISFLLALVAAVLGVLVSPFVFAATAVFAVVGVIFLLSVKKRASVISELSEKYGTSDAKGIRDCLSEYISVSSELEKVQNNAKELRENEASIKATLDIRARDCDEILRPFGIASDDLDSAQEKMKLDMLRREAANTDLLSAKIRLEALLQGTDSEVFTLPDYLPEEVPTESEEELSELLENLTLRRKNLEMTLAALRERLRGFDKEEAKKKLSHLLAKAEKEEELYDALSLAIDTLDASDRELKSRFSPEVEKRASEIFSSLTGGSFEVVRVINSDFDMSVATNAASAPKDKLYLSRGTYDELYLSLRLALCDTILPKEEAPPMILDDALVNFDDERTERTLRYLKDLAKTRQIILFTCHTREARFFENDSEVNKVAI